MPKYFYLSRALLCISWKNMISIYEHLKGTLSSVCIRGTCHDDRTLTAIRFEWYVCYNLTYSTIIDVVLLVMLSLCMQNYLRRKISIQFWLYMNITFVLFNYLNNLWYIIYGRYILKFVESIQLSLNVKSNIFTMYSLFLTHY